MIFQGREPTLCLGKEPIRVKDTVRRQEGTAGKQGESVFSAGQMVIPLQRTRVNLPPENSWQCLETFLVVTAGPGCAIASIR